jgi:hypothetical protein
MVPPKAYRVTIGRVRILLGLALAAQFAIAVDHVIVIGVDGLGAAWLRDANTPKIAKLMALGASTLHARAVIPTVSSPNWASMINGAGPAQHGITSNEWQPDKYEIAPVCKGSGGFFPTVFGVLREQRYGMTIGVFHHWKDFRRLLEKGSANQVVHIDDAVKTTDAAIAYWKQQRPALLFVHLDHVDHAGHDHGWGSAEYRAAVELADKLIGRVAEAAPEATIIVTADHGGSGTKHGGMTMGEIEIPWIAAGPGIRKGVKIAKPVNTYDTAVTIAYLLKIKPHECWIGRPVWEAVE